MQGTMNTTEERSKRSEAQEGWQVSQGEVTKALPLKHKDFVLVQRVFQRAVAPSDLPHIEIADHTLENELKGVRLEVGRPLGKLLN